MLPDAIANGHLSFVNALFAAVSGISTIDLQIPPN